MPSVGPNSASTIVNTTGIGSGAWSNPGNAASSDDTRASVTNMGGANLITNYLDFQGYGFSLPANATPVGAAFALERRRVVSSGSPTIRDHTIQMQKAGSLVGSNKADTATDWPTTEASVTYGGPTDMWGTTLTRSEAEASGFGWRVVAQNTTAGSIGAAEVDHGTGTIYYTVPGSAVIHSQTRRVMAQMHIQ